jgi:coenzyme F420-reducing hydrogenase delta subunit
MEHNDRSYQPDIVLLYCQHCVVDGVKVDVIFEKASGFSVRPVMLLCSSQVEAHQILKVLEGGADGVELVACPAEQCSFMDGSLRANLRVEYVQDLLDEIDMGRERVGISRGSGFSREELMIVAEKRATAVRALGARSSISKPRRDPPR